MPFCLAGIKKREPVVATYNRFSLPIGVVGKILGCEIVHFAYSLGCRELATSETRLSEPGQERSFANQYTLAL